MKTVQEYLREVDTERLIKEYTQTYPLNIWEIEEENLTIREIEESVQIMLHKYIERLKKMKVRKSADGKQYVFFAYESIEEDFTKNKYSLVCMQEILEKGLEAEDYAYEYTLQDEIMGYLISDVEYTQQNIYGLLVDVLFEASYFGYEQERLAEEKEDLENALKEISDSNDSVLVDWGCERQEEQDIKAEELRENAVNAKREFERYCKEKEMQYMKKALESEE